MSVARSLRRDEDSGSPLMREYKLFTTTRRNMGIVSKADCATKIDHFVRRPLVAGAISS